MTTPGKAKDDGNAQKTGMSSLSRDTAEISAEDPVTHLMSELSLAGSSSATRKKEDTLIETAPSADKTDKDEEKAVSLFMALLGPDMLARIAAFLDIRGGELLNFCMMVGSKNSDEIRRSFLLDNDDYLRYALMSSRGNNAKFKTRFNHWAEVNDWKSRINKKTDAQLEKLRGPLFVVCKFYLTQHEIGQMFLPPSLGGYCKYKAFHPSRRDLRALLKLKNNVHPGDWLLSVYVEAKREAKRGMPKYWGDMSKWPNCKWRNGSVMSHREIIDYVLEAPFDTTKFRVTFLRQLDGIYCNPSIAAELGLTDVVRYLVEEKGMSPTANDVWQGTGLCNVGNLGNFNGTISPVCSALVHSPDDETFRYFSTLEDIVLNSALPRASATRTLLYYAAKYACGVRNGSFKILANLPDIQVDTPDFWGNTALHGAAGRACLDFPLFPEHVEVVRILLEAGADPNARNTAPAGLTPLSVARKVARVVNAEDYDTHVHTNNEGKPVDIDDFYGQYGHSADGPPDSKLHMQQIIELLENAVGDEAF